MALVLWVQPMALPFRKLTVDDGTRPCRAGRSLSAGGPSPAAGLSLWLRKVLHPQAGAPAIHSLTDTRLMCVRAPALSTTGNWSRCSCDGTRLQRHNLRYERQHSKPLVQRALRRAQTVLDSDGALKCHVFLPSH
jgi:hypothetical protein